LATSEGGLSKFQWIFNDESIDIASSLTVRHLEKVKELEERIDAIEEDRAQFHCPHCDAEVCGIAGEDSP
jgi:hypothetical protein